MISFINDDVKSYSKSIQISNGSYNGVKLFRLLDLNTIESIMIGDNSFCCVDKFVIDGLNHLKSIKIGMKSFTQQKDNWNTINNSTSRSFSILNCIELESIDIGRYSFSDYAGEFKLINLPKLSTIKIGSIETDYSDSNNGGRSFNFAVSSFEIKGIIMFIMIDE